MRSRLNTLSTGHILLLALLIRLALFPVATYWYDMDAFRSWAHFFHQHPLSAFYASPDLGTAPDHLPGDLLVYAGLGRLLSENLLDSILFPFLIKLIGALADIGIGVLLWLAARELAPKRARLVLLCWLFNPAVIFISAIWGQLDALSVLFALAGIVAMLYGRNVLCWTPLAWACLIKPQLVVILPLVLLAMMYRERQLRMGELHVRPLSAKTGRTWSSHVRAGMVIAKGVLRSSASRASALGWIVAIGVVSLICWPFSVGILPSGVDWTLLERVQFAMDRHNNMVVGGHTLWSLILGIDAINPDSRIVVAGLSVKNIAHILTIAALLAIYGGCALRRSWRFTLTWGCSAAMIAMYVLPTRIHERYFLPALAFIILYSAIDGNLSRAKTLVVASPVVFLGSLLASYTSAYPIFGATLFTSALAMRLLSLGYIAIFAIIALAGFQQWSLGWRRNENPSPGPARENPVL